jgi:DNA-binding CsgD family transcriptional regulator
MSIRSSSSPMGVLLLDSRFHPLYFNAEGAAILTYPARPDGAISLEPILPVLVSNGAEHTVPSGRRRYRCRAFRLDARTGDGSPHEPRMLVVMERMGNEPLDITPWSDLFHLTTRERQTVALLLRGLSSKEIAAEMSISPSTVKTFLKLVMARTGASSRAQIVTKVMECAAGVRAPVLFTLPVVGIF